MGSRSARLRTKLVALVASLAALWAVAAWDVLRDASDLLRARTLAGAVAAPGEPLLAELQNERRLSVVYLGRPSDQQRAALAANRQRTTELAARFTESARDWRAKLAADGELADRVDEVIGGLDRLSRIRAAVDNRSVDRPAAAEAYTDVIDALFGAYDAMGGAGGEALAGHAAGLVQLQRARELAAQEDALIAGAIAAGRLSDAEYASFARLVGAQRFLARAGVDALPVADRTSYRQMSEGPAAGRFRALEDRIVQAGRPGAALPVSAIDWRNAAEAVLAELRWVVLAGGDSLAGRTTPAVAWVVARVVLVVGLGLIAVLAAIITAVGTTRGFARRLDGLGEAARRLADERLPAVLARLGRGEQVDVATEAPPLTIGPDEFGAVDRAVNTVREVAIRTVAEQGRSRRSERQVLLSLARRTEALVHRQLTLLDAMERREHDAEDLADLFRVDLLAARVRRNTENLIRLSDSAPGRTWRRDVPMIDVVRAAAAEVADHARVTVLPFGPVAVAGQAAGDVIHMLAELVENALSCSPPYTPVEIRGLTVGNGFVIEIEDRGLGMGEQELADANARIVGPAELTDAGLGLYVVHRLAERHDIKVQFKESPYGGTTAVVLIPRALVAELDGDAAVRVGGGPYRGPAVADVPSASGSPEQGVLVAAPVADGGLVAAPDGALLPRRRRAPAAVDAAGPDPGPDPPPADALPGPPPVDPDGSVDPDGDPPGFGPDAAGGGPGSTGSDPQQTTTGLPVRVRQANLAAPLREPALAAPPPIMASARPPEQVRRLMNSYQMGTRRGRTAAAELLAGSGAVEAVGPAVPAGDDRDIP